MKPPDAPIPSGERLIARLFMRALVESGHKVDLASRFRSFDKYGDKARQKRLKKLGLRLADRLISRYRNHNPADLPQLWFTYHLYHKAPDWIGPKVAQTLNIPYLAAEASFAPKQENGPWALGHVSVAETLKTADLVLSLNNEDIPCLIQQLSAKEKSIPFPPFLDTAPYRLARKKRGKTRRILNAAHSLDPDTPLLLAAAMMREGDKLSSYELLADALGRLTDQKWQILVAGDGPAKMKVRAAFHGIRDRTVWLGRCNAEEMASLYAASDLLVWPGIREAIGMSLLEAQAAGLPVVAGRSGAAPQIIEHGQTGLLCSYGDAADLARQVMKLLQDAQRRDRMGQTALEKVKDRHDLSAAGKSLSQVLERLIA